MAIGQDLPAELLASTGQVAALERPFQGGFYDVTILTAQRGRFVLKAGTNPERVAELHDECQVLNVLRAFAPFVPQPVAHVMDGETGLFLFTCIEGDNLLTALEQANEAGRHRLIAGLGEALRRIHGWQPPVPRPVNWLDQTFARIQKHIAGSAVPAPIDHSGEFGGRDPGDVLADLRGRLRATETDLVYGHGDFCLPNALAGDGGIVGIIDWSRGGYTDRRIDLAAGVWSTRYNLKDEAYVHTFLRAYGYTDTPDSLRPFEGLWTLLP